MPNPPPTVIGIDLGTTNSAVAVVRDGELIVIPVHGQPTMPSAVGLDPSGKLVVGRTAKNQAISAPEQTILSIKRLMGTDGKVELGGRAFRPEEISALIVGELKRSAEEFLGHEVTQAVITVPAFFNERQRQATQDAGRLAGLDVLRIINEPTAAALAYGAGQPDTRETLLVYDLGGGTFDVSVVRVENGVVEVRASHGDTHLGGDDFDAALAELAEKRFQEPHGDTPVLLPAASRRRLQSAMELAKIRLSDEPFASVREEYLTAAHHLETEIARTDYEILIEPWLRKSLDCLQQALADARLTTPMIDKVMLVGGATRTPMVHLMLAETLRQDPRHEIDPDLIVAMGAAIQGAALAGQPAPAILIDITAHTYSIKVLSDNPFGGSSLRCCPIIRRGTPLPAAKSEVFHTVMDSQTKVQIEVFQGEGLWPEENTRVGEFEIKGLADVPAGNEVVVQFRIDLNGLLTVTATEKRSGLVRSVAIDTAGQHRINLDAARTNLAALFAEQDTAALPHGAESHGFDDDRPEDTATGSDDDSSPADSARLLAEARSLRRRAEAILERGVSDPDAAAIRSNLAACSESIGKRDWPSLQDHVSTLSDLLFYLED